MINVHFMDFQIADRRSTDKQCCRRPPVEQLMTVERGLRSGTPAHSACADDYLLCTIHVRVQQQMVYRGQLSKSSKSLNVTLLK